MTLRRKAEILDKIMDMLSDGKINGVTIFDGDEELEKFFIRDLGLDDKEIRQLGFELYV